MTSEENKPQTSFKGIELSDTVKEILAAPRRQKKTKNYIDNITFYEALVEHQLAIANAEAAGTEKPPATKYICECFYYIADRYSLKPKFRDYPFREDMVLDAVSNCLKYMHNFNPEKGKNPFAYFTMYAHNAFIQRINDEKRELYVKFKSSVELLSICGGTYSNNGEDIAVHMTATPEYINKYITDYEDSMERKRLRSEERKRLAEETKAKTSDKPGVTVFFGDPE